MHEAYTGALVEAIRDVVSKEVGEEIEFQEIHRRSEEYFKTDDVVVLIGFGGDATGQVVISMDESSALGLTGDMLGRPVDSLDVIERSALGELGNMISAKAAALLFSEGMKCEITPPSLVIGKEVKIRVQNYSSVILIPLEVNSSRININIAFSKTATAD